MDQMWNLYVADLATQNHRIHCGYTVTYVKPQKSKISNYKVYNQPQLILKAAL